MRQLRADELRAAKADEDYKLLWAQALPLVKYALRKLQSRGIRLTDDLLQDCNLAAGQAVRRWNPNKGEFATWIIARVRGAAWNHQRRERSGMVGGRDAPGHTVTYEEELSGGDDDDILKELHIEDAQEAVIHGLANMALPDNADLLRYRFGLFGGKSSSVAELAELYGVGQRTMERRLGFAFAELAGIVQNSGYLGKPRRNA